MYRTSDNINLGKIPPQARDMEDVVLGAILIDGSAIETVIGILKPECFYAESNKEIYQAVINLFDKSLPVDILTVTEELRKQGTLDNVGGAFYVTELTNRVASSANIEYHAKIIYEKYIQREVIRLSTKAIKEAYLDTTDVFELVEDLRGGINIMADISNSNSIIGKQVIATIEERNKKRTGIKTGFIDLDNIFNGIEKTNLVVIGARPSQGKSALIVNIALCLALKQNKKVCILSMEMSAIEIIRRMEAILTGIDHDRVKGSRHPELTFYEKEQLATTDEIITNSNITIIDKGSVSLSQLKGLISEAVTKYSKEVFFIDYLQLINNSKKGANREQEIAEISRTCKALAKDHDIVIFLLSSLNRQAEGRGDKAPSLSDLRESGSIESDANIVMLMHSPEMYNIKTVEIQGLEVSSEGVSIINIAKNRGGATGTIPLIFKKITQKFYDYYRSDEPDNREFIPF